jgi:hypothetical protein
MVHFEPQLPVSPDPKEDDDHDHDHVLDDLCMYIGDFDEVQEDVLVETEPNNVLTQSGRQDTLRMKC